MTPPNSAAPEPPPGGFAAPAAFLEQLGGAWTTSLGTWTAWFDAWRAMMENRGAPATATLLGGLMTPGAWPGGDSSPLAEDLREILALPRFADLPGLDGDALPSFAPAMELMSLAQQYLTVAAPVWLQAGERFQSEVAERRRNGERLDSAGEALDLWNNVLDRTLMEFNRSSEFAELQQRFLRAAMRQRLETRKVVERAAKAVDMPSRAEIDDVYRRLHDLLREVHGLRREIRKLRQAAAPAGAEPRKSRTAGAGQGEKTP